MRNSFFLLQSCLQFTVTSRDNETWFIGIFSLIIILVAFRSGSQRVTSSMNQLMFGPTFVRVAEQTAVLDLASQMLQVSLTHVSTFPMTM